MRSRHNRRAAGRPAEARAVINPVLAECREMYLTKIAYNALDKYRSYTDYHVREMKRNWLNHLTDKNDSVYRYLAMVRKFGSNPQSHIDIVNRIKKLPNASECRKGDVQVYAPDWLKRGGLISEGRCPMLTRFGEEVCGVFGIEII